MSQFEFCTAVSKEFFFTGRPGDTRLGQWVNRDEGNSSKHSIALAGFPDDLGVRLNRGRAGAKEGPDGIRQHLYKMTLPMNATWDQCQLVDLGNLIRGADITETQARAEALSRAATDRYGTVIVLGGGHDFAAPNLSGFYQSKKVSMGLINVDPHLDVRELENGMPHSGTPFRQLLEKGVIQGKNFVQFGTRANRNLAAHFQYCQKQGVRVRTWEEVTFSNGGAVESFRAELNQLSRKQGVVALTIDMDSCADCEGTSAAPTLGFSARELYQIAELAGRDLKVQYLEFAEVAPELDFAQRSARIAAEILYSFMNARFCALTKKNGPSQRGAKSGVSEPSRKSKKVKKPSLR